MNDEIWRPIVGFEDGYEVSDLGRVRSVDRVMIRRGRWHEQQTYHKRGQLLRPQTLPGNQYRIVHLGHGNPRMIHRLVLEAFVGPCPDGMQCRHRDGDKANCRLANLSWGTPTQNAEDKMRHGTVARGIHHGRSKLDDDAVRQIRAAVSGYGVVTGLARRFGVNPKTVQAVRRGDTWAHVT